jgi:parvulin-like peptidyl-prolyl isomerase
MWQRFSRLPSVLVALTLLLSACSRNESSGGPVARVNGHEISKAELERFVERSLARYDGGGKGLPSDMRSRISASVLRRLVDDKTVELKADELGLKVAGDEVDKRLAEQKKRFRSEQAFADYLARSKNTEADIRAELQRSLLRDQLVAKLVGAVDVSPAEIDSYYRENLSRLTEQEQVRVSRILVRPSITPNAPDKDVKKARQVALAKAQQLRQRAVQPNADFGTLAAQVSEGPEKDRKGDLGWLVRGRMPLEFDQAAFTLPVGQVSQVVATQQGYELIKVIEKRAERQRALDQVADGIRETLLARKKSEKQREALRRLNEEAKVELLVNFDPPSPPTKPAAAGAPPLKERALADSRPALSK